ncbi:hypothetical protein [Bradyrhizobium elkanii]
MTEKQRKRRRMALIRILSDMSRNGWANARFEDYHPLETELAQLEASMDDREELKFRDFQARIRAAERRHCEADLYWRTNRWAIDGRGINPRWTNTSES